MVHLELNMSDSEDQSATSDNWTVCFDDPITVRFPPQPSTSDASFPFPITSVDIPLVAYQLSTDFHNISLTVHIYLLQYLFLKKSILQ